MAFSKFDIFSIKREIESLTKYKCCVVYGKVRMLYLYFNTYLQENFAIYKILLTSNCAFTTYCFVVLCQLPPETRSKQARLFNEPDTGYDILVASDAIGMGLNLNIRRIIFHTAVKPGYGRKKTGPQFIEPGERYCLSTLHHALGSHILCRIYKADSRTSWSLVI